MELANRLVEWTAASQPPRHTDSQLQRGEMCRESRYSITVSTFGGQPSPDITNRDRPQAAIVLAKGYHIPAKQNWSNLRGASTAEQQVHEVSQGLNQRTTCIPKSHQVQQMARSKAVVIIIIIIIIIII